MVYEVVHCSECGKPIKTAPVWLADVKVRFSCDSCRQKHPKPFAALDPALDLKAVGELNEDGEPVDAETTRLDDLLEEELADEEAAMEKAPED